MYVFKNNSDDSVITFSDEIQEDILINGGDGVWVEVPEHTEESFRQYLSQQFPDGDIGKIRMPTFVAESSDEVQFTIDKPVRKITEFSRAVVVYAKRNNKSGANNVTFRDLLLIANMIGTDDDQTV